jgi:hypothetical protein
MDAGLEHFDMGLVNYRQHPTNVNFIVYRFKDIQRAETFEEKLKSANLWYERSNPEEDEKELYMFAVEKKFFNKTQKLNFETEAEHKKFLIPNIWFRNFFVLFFVSVIVLASVGYCKSRKVLNDATEGLESVENNFLNNPTLLTKHASFK